MCLCSFRCHFIEIHFFSILQNQSIKFWYVLTFEFSALKANKRITNTVFTDSWK
jgi:hypothetical protein